LVLLVSLIYPILVSYNKVFKKRVGAIVSFFLVGAILLIVVGWSRSGFDESHPHPETIRYELDSDKSIARWVTGDHRLGNWTEQFIAPTFYNQNLASDSSLLEFYPTTFASPAQISELDPPSVKLLQDSTLEKHRLLKFKINTARQASMILIKVSSDTKILKASIANQDLDLEDYEWAKRGILHINYGACPPEGIELFLEVANLLPVQISLIELKDGLPENLAKAKYQRPKYTMPSPLGADCTVVQKIEIF
jgi:hypothetical protein